MTVINLVHRLRSSIAFARFTRNLVEIARRVLTSGLGHFFHSFHSTWKSYMRAREILSIPNWFVEYVPHSEDGDPVRCLCCGGVMLFSKEWNELAGSCGRSELSKKFTCPSYKNYGHGNCPITACNKFTARVHQKRDRWMIFKAWLTITELQRHGWCILVDVIPDLVDVTAIVAAVLPASVRLLKESPAEVLVKLPGVLMPAMKVTATRKINKSVIMHPVDTKRGMIRAFIEKARLAVNAGTRIEDSFPVWNVASIVMPS